MPRTVVDSFEQFGWNLGTRQYDPSERRAGLVEVRGQNCLVVAVPDEDFGRLRPCHQLERRGSVSGGQYQAGADGVRRVQPTRDSGVMNDRYQVCHATVFVPAESLCVEQGVVPVFGMDARNHLGHTGGTAGQLERDDVEWVDLRFDLFDHGTGCGGIGLATDVFQSGHAWLIVARLVADADDVPDAGMPGGVFACELDEIESRGAGLDDMPHGADLAADVPDLVHAVRGQSRDGNQAGLEAAVPGKDGLQAIGQLEDDRIESVEPEPDQSGRDLVGPTVQFGEAHRTLRTDHRRSIREPGGDPVVAARWDRRSTSRFRGSARPGRRGT